MIIDLIMLYTFIVGMSLAHWAFIRVTLYRGLALAFLKERQKSNFNYFMTSIRQRYLQTLIWTVLHVLLVGFVSARLLYLSGLLSLETMLISLAILIFFAKDRLHYATAILVMSRVNHP